MRGKLPASAGPFFVAEYQPGEYVRLARNPNYWKRDAAGKQMPYLDSIRIDIQPNRDIELTRFLRGETQSDQQSRAGKLRSHRSKSKPGAARNLGASLDSEFLWFNQSPSTAMPEWKTKVVHVRRLPACGQRAIHRDDIARIVFRGHAHPAPGPISPSNRFWFNAALKPLPFDSQAPLQALATEGFVLRDGVLRDREGHAVEFSLITNSGNRAREAMAPVIQDDLARSASRSTS